MTEKNKIVNLNKYIGSNGHGRGIYWNKVNTKIYPIII